jgi:NAD(P)-dependent dehydrogenase (short-subunit alcohol dehydrogenase family)
MLTGRVALISGATGGLGAAVTRVMLEDGAAVVAVARSEDDLTTLRVEMGAPDARWLAIAADLTDPDATARAVQSAVGHFGGLDIVLALAGGWRGGKPLAETDPAALDWLWQVNVVTAFNLCHAAVPALMDRKWGRIVTIAARSAVGGSARSAAYAATKAAVLVMTQSLAAEVKGAGITANCILPATIDTPANRAATPGADFSKWVTPEQIATAIRFLCSDEASAINGAALPIYGGG